MTATPRSEQSAAFLGWAVLPIVLVAAAFWAVLQVGEGVPFPRRSIPHEAFRPDRCTWVCHNRGCRHAPRLPPSLSGDDGLFGWAVGRLHDAGRVLMPHHPAEGYGVANLLLFCVLWPALMWGLYLKVVSQAQALWRLRQRRAGRISR